MREEEPNEIEKSKRGGKDPASEEGQNKIGRPRRERNVAMREGGPDEKTDFAYFCKVGKFLCH